MQIVGIVGTQRETTWNELTMETCPVCSVVFTMARKTNRKGFGDNGGRKVRKQKGRPRFPHRTKF